jgi:two-component system, chemotaxis family, chemotaxis protein CheY
MYSQSGGEGIMKAIVADDSMLTRKIVIKYAKPLGFDFFEACDGKEVIDILNREPELPQLILMDWNMPEMDGLEALKWMKKDERLKGVPVIMLTSESDDISRDIAMKAGATAYIPKPFAAEELLKTIRETIG